jgi:hypothetical protein
MSRSNPTLTNPSQHFFSWVGSKGILVWYDKDNQKNVEVKLPFTFMVLDELATISGFSKRDQSSYWSNEVRNVANEEFIVKTSKGIKQAGLYKDLADVRAKGAKYAKSIYIAHRIGDDYVIGNIKALGSCLSAWIEFSSRNVVGNGSVILTGSSHVPEDHGINEYYIPTFEYHSSTDEENEIAIVLDRELQVYLNQYLAASKFNRSQEDEANEVPKMDDEPLPEPPESEWGEDKEDEANVGSSGLEVEDEQPGPGYSKYREQAKKLKAKKVDDSSDW